MKQNKIKYVVQKHLPERAKSVFKPLLSPEQVEKLKYAGSVVLAVLAAAGTLTLAAAAPNAVQLLGYLPGLKSGKRFKGYDEEVVKSVYYLKKRGYIKLKNIGTDIEVKITEKGRKKILKLDIKNVSVPPANIWDGKWWVTIADVPVEERHKANYLREKLKDMGFYPLQRTVWLYPFDPRDQVDFVSAYYDINPFLTVMRVDRLDAEDEKELVKFFKENRILRNK